MIGDVHVHSKYSTDSDAEMEDSVIQAVGLGLSYLCFTDHIDYDFPYENVSFEFDVEEYLRSIHGLQEKYGGKSNCENMIAASPDMAIRVFSAHGIEPLDS